MDLTETKETEKGTTKNKYRETEPNYPQEQATHFSDCIDQACWGVIQLKLYPSSTELPKRFGPI